ncbi:MAG: hypothetical protein E6J90_11045 [Deltaproteobacteria bacterium]|nr:MAG: hypothetical protein E6J91_11110 [Deltaproteobacteria bacterium]TMQ23195.1 MAG: hypothetical protein E6J90_11045 [Deltaproteobacteria bacterium]
MARTAVIALLVAGWLTGAHAAPLARQRVVLADPDPELRHAMEQALAPWHLEVVIEGPPPADEGMAQERADADTARFVVWRDGEQLVVYDRELGSIERRDSRSGVLDPPTAAAAALTIKTMMRLPPPPPETPPPPPPDEPGIEVRVQAGVATRISRGIDTEVSMRLGGAVAIRPWPRAGWRFGIGGDAGTATSIDRAGFKGTWSEWAALGIVSWTYARGAWEIEPHAGFGVRHSSLDGLEMTAMRSEAATLTTGRAGVAARWRYARLSLGVVLDIDGTFGTVTYTKTNSPAEVFQIPGAAVELGALAAVDL